MTRIFLSYAMEDETTAKRLVSWFESAGIELFWWQDKEQQGKRFIGEIENGIGGADLFVVLMSPNYLSSGWCRHESNLALQRENDLHNNDRSCQFIYVLKVVETSLAEAGFLRNYGWLDLTAPLNDKKLGNVSAALHLDRAPVPVAGTVAQVQPQVPRLVFRNRDDELNSIVKALTTTGGQDLWLVISPPRMGKSWLLNQVERKLAGEDPNCAVRLLDLRERPADLRVDPTRLLRALLNVDGPAFPLSDIATEISRRGRPQLYLLDSADLLDTKCAAELRSALTKIYKLVQQTGTRTSRLSVLIGSRRHDDWKGLDRDPACGVRFRPLALTGFGVDVVHQALIELNRNLGAEKLWDYANRLHRLSEGLPALLVLGLHWAEKTEFLKLDESEGKGTFDAVARPYIQDDLLSAESLLPFGGHNLAEEQKLLERTLRILVAYRLFTQSHLRYHVGADRDFQSALRAAGWSLDDLWRAVRRTALLKRPLEEPWEAIHEPIRRLLYRYYYDSDQVRCEAHATARQFYKSWPDGNAGKEQAVVLVECLWHEAARMVIEQPLDVPSLLPRVAEELAGDFGKSSIYEPAEFSDFVSQRLGNDEEFRMVFRKYDSLFDEIVERVEVTVSGGA